MLHFINTSGGGGGIDIFIVTARILSGVIIQYNNISVVLCCVVLHNLQDDMQKVYL